MPSPKTKIVTGRMVSLNMEVNRLRLRFTEANGHEHIEGMPYDPMSLARKGTLLARLLDAPIVKATLTGGEVKDLEVIKEQ